MSLRSKMPPTSNFIPPSSPEPAKRQLPGSLHSRSTSTGPIGPSLDARSHLALALCCSLPPSTFIARSHLAEAGNPVSLFESHHTSAPGRTTYSASFEQLCTANGKLASQATAGRRVSVAHSLFIFGCSLVVSWSVSVRTATHNPPQSP